MATESLMDQYRECGEQPISDVRIAMHNDHAEERGRLLL